eukprot:scaffold3502_cov350-Prasinococcus_capsulatus_cf.AAC.5
MYNPRVRCPKREERAFWPTAALEAPFLWRQTPAVKAPPSAALGSHARCAAPLATRLSSSSQMHGSASVSAHLLPPPPARRLERVEWRARHVGLRFETVPLTAEGPSAKQRTRGRPGLRWIWSGTPKSRVPV